jgi:sterol desaturase/sphingolipid hydroxylase (fatty acid hydroxylase superfamily)
METYAKLLNIAIPIFISLIILEAVWGWLKDQKIWNQMDTLSSLSSGLTNVIKDVLGLTFVIVSYDWMVKTFALVHIANSFWVYLLAFIGLDFAGYWVHRISHHVNFFWNTHIIHHSSEEFNLACALRQSISNFFSITVFFLFPVALLGIPTEVIGFIAPLHLFAQYWYHTRLIGKLGYLENIIVTPSAHRVHHAINPEYLDKNLSQIFIIWDKIFGTYQEELDHVPPVYGVTKPVSTFNPILINFQHLWQLIKDAWRTQSIWDKIRIWFMPTGWRPADLVNKDPLPYVKDPYQLVKYSPKLNGGQKVWVWIQFILTFSGMMYLFNHISDYSWSVVLAWGLFLFGSIFSFTSFMDKSRLTIPASILTSIMGVYGLMEIIQLNQSLTYSLIMMYMINPFIQIFLYYRE